MLKKHQILEQAVEDYAESAPAFKDSRGLVAATTQSERIGMRQSQVDKLYAGLKDLSEERRGKLEERFRLFQLNREVDDLEQWIAEREVVAGSHELGQDYEHVTVRQLQEDAVRLQSAYAGDKADDIQRREGEVLEAWRSLLEACEGRRTRLLDTGDKFRFFSMVRDLMLWMEDVIRLIETQEKP
ncbi:hypothetical protein cypCar_00048606, partial [Cyprinus carpio]